MSQTRPPVVAAAQLAVKRGDLDHNITRHMAMMQAAADAGVDILVFPELSLTGYELDLAHTLAACPDDPAFAPLQALARRHTMLVMAGMPLKAVSGKPHIGALIFGQDEVLAYHKLHLHGGENAFCQPGFRPRIVSHMNTRVAATICADLQHVDYAADLAKSGTQVYACGALISEGGYACDSSILAGYAARHDMIVVLTNFCTVSGGWQPAGKSAIWGLGGTLLAQAQGCEKTLVIARP